MCLQNDSVGDLEVDIFAGNRKIANIWNATTDLGMQMGGDPTLMGAYKRTFLYIPRGTPLVCEIATNTTGTNSIGFGLIMQRVPPRRGYIGGCHFTLKSGSTTAIDFAEGESWNMTNYPRILRDVAYVGSNATGECSLRIVAGNVELGS